MFVQFSLCQSHLIARVDKAELFCSLAFVVGPLIAANMSSSAGEISAVARYDHYKLWRMHIETEEQLEVMKELERRNLGIEFIGHVRKTDQQLTILVPARAAYDMADVFRRYKMTNEVLVENMQEVIDRQREDVKPKETKGAEMDWTHYFHLQSLMDYLSYVSEKHSCVTLLEIGRSFEDRPIQGIKISKGPGRTAVFVEGGIHAREWISPATVTYLINQLLTSTVPEIQALANDYDWYFFPVVNPDGYFHTFEVDRLWRKNRKPYGLFVGVDLNRNFDSNWNGSGSSADPLQFDFAGSNFNSEPEVKCLSAFLAENKASQRIETFISLHSYSQLIMFPYGHTEVPVDNYADLKAIGEAAAAAIKARHGQEYKSGSINETIYPSSGGSSDFVRSLGIQISYTFELRPAPDATEMFILPASQITAVGEETTAAFVALMKEAKARGYYNKK